MKTKQPFIPELQNYKLACMADPAHQGRIGRVRQMVILKSNDNIFFDAHFVFICVKSFKKVHSQLFCILLGLGQSTSHM